MSKPNKPPPYVWLVVTIVLGALAIYALIGLLRAIV